jgi:hypothetical protein
VAPSGAVIEIGKNGAGWATVSSGTASSSLAVTPSSGTDQITVRVTAADGVTQLIYTLTVMFNDGHLSALSLSVGSRVGAAFTSTALSGIQSVPPATTSLTVTATPVAAAVSALGWSTDGATYTALTAGTASAAITVTVGVTRVYVRCVSADGTDTEVYYLDVESNDPSLSALTFSPGVIVGGFNAAAGTYTLSVPISTTSIAVTATKAAPVAGSLLQLGKNGAGWVTLTSGTPSSAVPVTVGTDALHVKVTAGDTVQTRTLIFNVLYNEGHLSALSLSTAAVLVPSFTSSTLAYTGGAAPSTTTLTVTATAMAPQISSLAWSTNSGGTYTTFATGSNSGTSGPITVTVGTTSIWVRCISQDLQDTEVYTVAVRSNDAALTALATSAGSFTTTFTPATLAYLNGVPAGTSAL